MGGDVSLSGIGTLLGMYGTVFRYSVQLDQWTDFDDLPEVDWQGATWIAVGDFIYGFGGFTIVTESFAYSYSPGANASLSNWTALQSMPTPRVGASAIAYGHQAMICVIGGVNHTDTDFPFEIDTVLNTVECYDIAADVWYTNASINVARTDHSAVVVDCQEYQNGVLTDVEYIYVVGGNQTAERYDPSSGAWTTLSVVDSATRARFIVAHSPLSSAPNETVYAIGGYTIGDENNGASAVQYVTTLDRHNCILEETAQGAPSNATRIFSAAVLLGDYIYVSGPTIDDHTLETVQTIFECYSITNNTWSYKASIPAYVSLDNLVTLDDS